MNERQIFEAALDIAEPARREAFLSQACGADAALRARVDALLTAHAAASQFLETPAVQQLNTPPDSSGEATLQLPPSHVPAEGDSDADIPNAPDLSFLSPSTKPGSIGTLGHYEILNVLGQGAFGIVFRAFDEKLHRHVAIKTMSVQMAATSPPRKRFLREARAAAAIRHENVVQVYSVEEQPLPYLVMEFIDGQTLQQKQRDNGPLELPELLHIGRQIASGLAAAHAQTLIHRDVKPGNILLENGAEQKVKITDFGLARAADDASLTRSGMISGTPLYMAPEQALGQTLDHRSDLFSLGSVLYELATGRPPFRAPTTVAVLRRVVDDTPRPIQEIIPETPDWLVEIIYKLLSKQPDQRYQSAKEVADLLARCQSELQLTGQVTCIPMSNPASGAASAPRVPVPAKDSGGSRPPLASVHPASPARGILGQAWHEWWSEIDRWIALSIQTLLILVHLGCMICLLSMGASSGHDAEGHATFEYRLGIPSPWFRFLVYPEPLKPFQTMLNLFSSSMLIGLVGCLAYYVNWRIEKVRNPQMSKWDRPGIILGFWGLAALIAVSLGLWQGYAALDKPGVAVESANPASGAASAPRVPATPADSGGSRPPLATGWHGWPADAPPPAIAPFNAEQAQQHQAAWAKHLGIPAQFTDKHGMKFVFIPPGEFQMGATAAEVEKLTRDLKHAGADDYDLSVAQFGGPQHPVRITQPFYKAAHEVTVAEYRRFIESTKYVPSMEQLGNARYKWSDSAQGENADRRAVIGVSWDDAVAYCKWRSEQDGLSIELPTEAQWEYACRAGTTTLWSFGDDVADLEKHVVYHGPSYWPAEVVGTKLHNPFGLFDMHGNADEWCTDWHNSGFYAKSPLEDPVWIENPMDIASGRVSRGGSSHSAAWWTRSSTRPWDYPAVPANPKGFRVVLTGDLKAAVLKNAKPEEMRTGSPANGWHGWPAEAPPHAIAPFNAEQALQHQAAWAKYLNVPVEYTNSLGMQFRLIPPGEFMMGSTPAEIEAAAQVLDDPQWLETLNSEAPQHKVILTQPFYLGMHEVTQGQYAPVMGQNPAFFSATGTGKEAVVGIDTTRFPVEIVSWDEVTEYCEKLSQSEQLKSATTKGDNGIACRRRRNGSGPVGQARYLNSAPAREKTISRRPPGLMPTPRNSSILWVSGRPVRLGCTTLTAMSGSGSRMAGNHWLMLSQEINLRSTP